MSVSEGDKGGRTLGVEEGCGVGGERSGVLAFVLACHSLKEQRRSGWVAHGVRGSECESIADHMHFCALLALVARPEGMDGGRLVQLAVVHDLAEALVGDLMPGEVLKAEKHRREAQAMADLSALLRPLPVANQIVALWEEYENASTPEAQFLKQIDKLEMLIQAYVYEKRYQSALDYQKPNQPTLDTHHSNLPSPDHEEPNKANVVVEKASTALPTPDQPSSPIPALPSEGQSDSGPLQASQRAPVLDSGSGLDLSDFFDEATLGAIKAPTLRPILAHLLDRRARLRTPPK